MRTPEALLQQYFGHREFRSGQKQAIDAILQGRDVLAIMPLVPENPCAIRFPPCSCRG